MTTNISHLPNEILEHIAESCSVANNVTALNRNARNIAIAGFVDLKALSQTCRKFYQIMTPILYRAVWVKDDESIERLSRTLLSRPELAKRTQAVNFFYSQNDEEDPDVHFLTNLPNLRHLYFYCEDYLNCWEENEDETWNGLWYQAIQPELFGLGPFSGLQSCFLSLQDNNCEFWRIETAWQVFAHPTLEVLTFDYVSTDQLSAHGVERRLRSRGISASRSTSLKELHFFNSDITPDGLMVLLQYPKNLKVLTLSDPYCYPPIDEHGHFSTEEYLQSMSAVTSSLEFLWIWEHKGNIFPGPAYGLSNFTSLRVLDVDSCNLFGDYGTKVEETKFETIIAPNLELLIICRLVMGHEEYLLKFAKRQPELCPNLRRIILDHRYSKDKEDISTGEWCTTLKESGVEVVFEVLVPHSANDLTPPQPNPFWGYIDGNFWRS